MTTPTPKDAPPFDPPVFCSGIERDCKHGQLARSCRICELERDLAAAQQEAITAGGVVDILNQQLAATQEDKRQLALSLRVAYESERRLTSQIAKEIEATTAAQSELASVKAENSKLRSALSIVHFKQEPWQ